ncbi:MAG TPA: hypothetical protein VEK57_06860 [Thermoanaerobaculia bacterium]|nr:hypothetical protein [Thermoanaerobaculia bacterium]
MNRSATALLTLCFTLSLSAQQLLAVRDDHTEMLTRDLHAVARIAHLAEDLGRERQVLLAILDSDIKTLRGPRDDGTFQWAALQREEGGRVTDEKAIEYVHTEKELRNVTLTAPNAYRVEVNVPKKRGMLSANNRVFVRNVIADITGFDGKTTHHEIEINRWVNPGDSEGGPLPSIGKSVKATVELGVESGDKKATAEVALVQAKLVDDPNSPYFPAVTRLVQVRELVAAREMDRGRIKNAVDEALLSMPGELDRRTTEMEEAARIRRSMVDMGTLTGSINAGDATPDVVRELDEIIRMMSGTLDEQTEARKRLLNLVSSLKPRMEP